MAKLLYTHLLTTGRVPRIHGIYTIALAMEINGEVVDTKLIQMKIFDKKKVNLDRLNRANISEDDIRRLPEPEKGYKELISFLDKHIEKGNKKDKAFIVGFDVAKSHLAFLSEFFFDCTKQPGVLYDYIYSAPIDVFVIAAHKLMEERRNMGGFGIGHVAGRFNVDFDINKVNDAEYIVDIVRLIHKQMS